MTTDSMLVLFVTKKDESKDWEDKFFDWGDNNLPLPLDPATALALADALEQQVQKMGGVL